MLGLGDTQVFRISVIRENVERLQRVFVQDAEPSAILDMLEPECHLPGRVWTQRAESDLEDDPAHALKVPPVVPVRGSVWDPSPVFETGDVGLRVPMVIELVVERERALP